jgi:hypothetical protein
MKREDVFPTFPSGFFADVRIIGYHLRLFAHVNESGWASSVYCMRLNSWISKARVAKNAQQAKSDAEDLAREQLPGTHKFEWREIGVGAVSTIHASNGESGAIHV